MCKINKVLIISMLICIIPFSTYAVDTTDLNELQNQKSEIEMQIDENNNQLANINDELTQNLQQIQELDGNIQKIEETLNNLNEEITKKEEEISKIEKDLKKITKKYNKQKDLLDSRLVSMYEAEDTNYLDVVLGSDSISDFISSYYLISEITSYDMDLLELVDNQKKEIEEKNTKLNIEKEKLQSEKITQQKTQMSLANTKILRENQIIKLTEEEREVQAKIDQYNSQVKEIEDEIKSLASIVTFGEDYKGGPMKWPIYGHYTITSNYGMRTHPITGVYKLHTGVDIRATTGTEFTAIADGIVVKSGYNSAYGNMIVIDHGGGVQTLYAHGSEIIAKLGQEVKAGDVVLKVGSTGYSTGPHAHFEVRVNGSTVNPLDYVSIPNE